MKSVTLRLDGGQFLIDVIGSLVVENEEDLFKISDWMEEIIRVLGTKRDSEDGSIDLPFNMDYKNRALKMIQIAINTGQIRGAKATAATQVLKVIRSLNESDEKNNGDNN